MPQMARIPSSQEETLQKVVEATETIWMTGLDLSAMGPNRSHGGHLYMARIGPQCQERSTSSEVLMIRALWGKSPTEKMATR